MAQTKAQLLGPVVGDVVMDVSTLSLDAEGNKVGIGTTEADLTLHVNGVNALPSTSGSTPTGHLTLRAKAQSSSHGMYMGVSNASPWGSWIQAQDASNNATNYPLLLNPNGGDVGIGEDVPRSLLHLNKSTGTTSSYNTGTLLRINGTGGANTLAGIGFGYSTAANDNILSSAFIGVKVSSWTSYVKHDLVFATRDVDTNSEPTERLRIAADGDLEYRYNDADTSTEVGATQVPHGFRILNQNNTLGRLGGITFAHGGGESANAGIFHETTNIANTSTVGIGDLTFWMKPAGSSYMAERLRITSAGNLGINCTPTERFHINGGDGDKFKLDCPNDYSNSSSIIMSRERGEIKTTIDASGGNPGGSMVLRTRNTSGTMVDAITIENGQQVSINSVAGTHPLTVSNGGVQRLRIDSVGRMGLGVSPSDFGTNRTALEIHSPSATVTHLALTNSTTGSNGASNGFNIIQNGNNALLYLRENANMTFSTNNTERIHIAANGQVLVGNYATHSSIHGNLEINGNDGINISNATRNGTNGAQWRLIPHNGGGSATNLRLFEGAGGVEVINITKTGKIGINQTDPQGDLHIGNISGSKDLIMHSANNGNARVRFREGGSNASGFNEYSIGMVGNRNAITVNGQGFGEIISILGDNGNVGIGNDNPTVALDVKRATAGLIGKFYDTGSNGGALYNGGPIVGLSRVSNGSVSLDGLLFQVGWDKNNTATYNIDETVFAVGNKGVGVGEDDPQVMLHCSKGLSSTSSFKDAQMIRIAGTNGVNTMAGIGFGYNTTSPATSAYPSAWIGAKVSSWTAYVKHDLIFATRGTDTNTEPVERFRITESGKIEQNFDSEYVQKGHFNTLRSSQNATNCPTLATTLSYGFGYQEAFTTTGGTWVHPYPNLVLGYHTGVMIGGHINYQGTRFYADHPAATSTVLMSVGNGSYNVVVANTLSKGGGTFRIAHPHPSKKYTHDLQHSFIEGPQCDNLYRGKVDLVDGTASINIDTVSNMTDGTFVLLNRDIQCFTSNETGWTAVKGSVSGNILTITAKSSSCTDTISWMVIGERQDDKIKSPEMEMTDSDGKLIVEPLTIEESHM